MKWLNAVVIDIFILGLLSTAANAQADATIKAAKSAATSAGLNQYKRFSNNDSLPWVWGGDMSFTFTSTALTNWAGGGLDQILLAPALNVYANYKKGKLTWENYGYFNYGIQKNGDYKAIKNSDNINIVTKVGRQASAKWFYSSSLLARTQFSPGYRYSATDTIRVSDFCAPIQLFLSLGMDWRPNGKISVMFSPLMGKATFARSNDLVVLSNSGLVKTEKDASGVDVQVPSHSRYEFGGGLTFTMNGTTWKNKLSYNTSLDLFTNYAEKPENIDITWWITGKWQIFKFMSLDARFDLYFDDDKMETDANGVQHGAKVQMKSYAGVSLFYQFK